MIKLVLDLRQESTPQTYAEYEPEARKYFNAQKIFKGQVVLIEVKVYAGEKDKFDLDIMENHLKARGAKVVEFHYNEYERSD
jgi:hypothetical protein